MDPNEWPPWARYCFQCYLLFALPVMVLTLPSFWKELRAGRGADPEYRAKYPVRARLDDVTAFLFLLALVGGMLFAIIASGR